MMHKNLSSYFERSFLLLICLINHELMMSQWEVIKEQVSADRYYNSVHFVNDSTGFVVSDRYVNEHPYPQHSYIEKTTDYGVTWTQVFEMTYNQADGLPSRLSDVFFINENVGWVCGIFMPFVLKTTDGGSTWTMHDVSVPTYPNFSLVKFEDENHGFCLNRYDGWHTIETNDGGLTWSLVDSLSGYDLSFLDNCNFIIGQAGRIKRVTDCEYNPLIFPSSQQGSFPKRTGRHVKMFDTQNYLFTALGLAGTYNFASIVTTHDGGNTFSYLDFPITMASFPTALEFASDTHGYLSLSPRPEAPCAVLKTVDGGTTWHCLTTEAFVTQFGQIYSDFYMDISCPSPEICYGINDYRVSKTLNGGGPLGQMYNIVSEVELPVVGITLHPNPATQSLTLTAGQAMPAGTWVQMHDMAGRVVHSERLPARTTTHTLDVAALAPGVYTCTLQHHSQRYQTIRWVRE